MIRSILRAGVRAIAIAAVAAAGTLTVHAGSASATDADSAVCLARETFTQPGYHAYVCVTEGRAQCDTWVRQTANAVRGTVVKDTCRYVAAGAGGWAHPAGHYGAVHRRR